MTASAGRIGLVVPSLNVVVEDEFHEYLPREWRPVTTRVTFEGGGAAALSEMNAEAVAATRLVRAADIRALVYACTSATFIGGPDGERALAKSIAGALGIDKPVIMTSFALIEALGAVTAGRRIALATPYTDDLNVLQVSYFNACGYEVVDMQTLALDEASDAGRYTAAEVEALARRLLLHDADAVVISCTNLRALEVIASLESAFDLPVVASNQAMLWKVTQELDIDMPPGLGSLFDDRSQRQFKDSHARSA